MFAISNIKTNGYKGLYISVRFGSLTGKYNEFEQPSTNKGFLVVLTLRMKIANIPHMLVY